jgi:hypothetical protein
MENKTAIQVLKNSLIEVSKSMKSVSIEGLMISIDYLESIEKENIMNAYHDGFSDGGQPQNQNDNYYNQKFLKDNK